MHVKMSHQTFTLACIHLADALCMQIDLKIRKTIISTMRNATIQSFKIALNRDETRVEESFKIVHEQLQIMH